MSQKWEVKNKCFIITGGASGLGAEYVKMFLGLGAKNIAVLDIAEETGKVRAEYLNTIYKEKVIFIKCDVSNEEDITESFEAVLAKFGQIDVIINNAGILDDSPNNFRSSCAVNWEGVVSFTFKAIKYMRTDEGGAGGTIINISSIGALSLFPFVPAYSGSKLAVLHFSQCISMDPFYANTNVRILTMCFGATDTPILRNLENRCYEPKNGKEYSDIIATSIAEFQKVESGAAALVYMFENGAPGSIWLSAHNRPAKNITSDIKDVFQKLQVLTV